MTHMLWCAVCSSQLLETDHRHHHFAWAVLWMCPTCKTNVHRCDNTCGYRSVITYATHEQLRRHNNKSHKRPRLALLEAPDDCSDTAPAWEPCDVERPICHPIPLEPSGMFQDAPATLHFFEDLGTYSFGVAVQHLVARSCYQHYILKTIGGLAHLWFWPVPFMAGEVGHT